MSQRTLIAWLGGTLALTAGIAHLAHGAPPVLESLALLGAPVPLPPWALAALCLFPSFAATRLVRRVFGCRDAAPVGPEAPAAAPAVPADERPQRETAAALPSPPARPLHDYQEDAAFGVVWRWYDDPETTELLACCPACDDALVPLANGGSLSRGLHCERCNKLRAAGEHPVEVHAKVQQMLAQRARSGEWRGALGRVERARSVATRPLSELPAP